MPMLGQPRGERVDFAPRRAVDDAGLAPMARRARRAAAASASLAAARGRAGWADRTIRRARADRSAPSCAAMSCRTRAVAVAVYAWRLTPGSSCRSRPSCRYSGRKSCPHWLMQCASSTATKLTPHDDSSAEEAVAAVADQPLGRDVEQAVAALAQAGDDVGLLVRRRASCCRAPRARRCRRACPPDPSSAR